MKRHDPKPGRRAYICDHAEHKSPPRVFVGRDQPVPQCRKHGKLKRQTNRPYLGQPIPEASRG